MHATVACTWHFSALLGSWIISWYWVYWYTAQREIVEIEMFKVVLLAICCFHGLLIMLFWYECVCVCVVHRVCVYSALTLCLECMLLLEKLGKAVLTMLITTLDQIFHPKHTPKPFLHHCI